MLLALLAVAIVRYTHPSCGYSFEHFADWSVVASEDDQRPCEVRVVPPDENVPPVWIDAGRGGEEGAMRHTGFARVDAKVKAWAEDFDLPDDAVVVFGRDRWSRTAEIHVGELEGRRANDVALACAGEPEGGRLCPRDLAYLTNCRQWVNVDSEARSAAFELALRSISINPPAVCTYTHPACGYSFRHPADWTVVEDEDVCTVLVQPPGDDAVGGDSVRVKVGEGGFEEGAAGADFMRGTDEIAEAYDAPQLIGAWVILGRELWSAGRPIATERLHGLRADDVISGRFHVRGASAGLGVSSVAFLSDGQRWVAVDGDTTRSDTFDIILESVTFVP